MRCFYKDKQAIIYWILYNTSMLFVRAHSNVIKSIDYLNGTYRQYAMVS